MPMISDQRYLSESQYKTPANLQARIILHQRFSTNPYPWQRWVFEQLELQPGMRLLEVGCGPGDLWRENLDRLPPGMRITLGDLSTGMAAAARAAVDGQPAFSFIGVDAQHIPL
ncbi:MAG: methyltransferase domain-containing protein, partial [Anaerolineales bacterium]|nr:methyltransferase domain-containing protein [Anaerolineales bacterium]